MKIIVIGLGSMGRRRIRLLKQYNSSFYIIGVDAKEKRRKQAENELGIETDDSIKNVIKKGTVDCAFICTSPLSHASIVTECLQNGMNVFTELNLVSDGYYENISLAKEKGKALFISSTLMYRREIQWIKQQVMEQSLPVSYQYHVGNYLPDWHPWESYRDFFVGQKKTNGCREFMALEFPWLLDVFGEVKEYYATSVSTTGLELDYPDTVQLLLMHKNGNHGMLQIDVASRNPVRDFKCSGENIYITWNGTPETLQEYDIGHKELENIQLYDRAEHLGDYNKTIIEDAYYEEIVNFMDVMAGRAEGRHTFEKDLKIIQLIDEIERRY